MTLGSISCAKHLGGVSTIRLLSVSEIGMLSYNSATRCFEALQPAEGCEWWDVVFAEGTASLEERVADDGTTSHKLSFVLHGLQCDVVEVLQRLSQEGVVAVVGLREGGARLVGYSPEAADDYPLRLREVVMDSGCCREQRTTLTLTLGSIDASPSCPYID